MGYEDSITATQTQKQDIKTKENEQQASLIRYQIDVMVSEYNNNITVTLNGAKAEAMRVMKTAEAEAAKMKIDAENEALELLKQKMPTLSAEQLVAYQRNFAYQTMPNATFLFGVQNAVTVLGSGTQATGTPSCAAS